MNTEVNPFFCPMDKKMISPDIEWCIGIFPGFCTIILKTSIWYLELMLYYAVNLEILDTLFCFHVYAQTMLWGL